MSSIATTTGDAGTTALVGGTRVSKADLRVECYGTVDELNTVLGFARAICTHGEVKAWTETIQRTLFRVGAALSTTKENDHVKAEDVAYLTDLVHKIEATEGILADWSLPGAHVESAAYEIGSHRLPPRRTPRRPLQRSRAAKSPEQVIPYLNRLSDLIWLFGRLIEVQDWRRRHPPHRATKPAPNSQEPGSRLCLSSPKGICQSPLADLPVSRRHPERSEVPKTALATLPLLEKHAPCPTHSPNPTAKPSTASWPPVATSAAATPPSLIPRDLSSPASLKPPTAPRPSASPNQPATCIIRNRANPRQESTNSLRASQPRKPPKPTPATDQTLYQSLKLEGILEAPQNLLILSDQNPAQGEGTRPPNHSRNHPLLHRLRHPEPLARRPRRRRGRRLGLDPGARSPLRSPQRPTSSHPRSVPLPRLRGSLRRQARPRTPGLAIPPPPCRSPLRKYLPEPVTAKPFINVPCQLLAVDFYCELIAVNCELSVLSS